MDRGWNWLGAEGALAAWQAACDMDGTLRHRLPGAEGRFAVVQPGRAITLDVRDGQVTLSEGAEAPTIFAASAASWGRFLQPIPARHHQNLLAMRMRVADFTAEGDQLAWAQHVHLIRRVLDIGRWLARGEAGPAPASLRPRLGTPTPCPPAQGRYVTVRAQGRDYVLYGESSGTGRPILGMHTAGSDSRQFHRLMSEPRLAEAGYALTTFDLPGHGRSPAIVEPGAWRLTTDLYAELILGFREAWGFTENPVLLGASMSGEICLEIALRAPERFAHIIACESSEHIEGRRTPFPDHPRVNAAIFTPEWIEGLMAPQSPAECAAEIWWHYSQGGCGTFPGDIHFYSGDWDARDRVHRIDTTRCPLTMLTGEYDYSCTAEHSAETAAKIKGASFAMMPGIGHFPFAENPALFTDHLLAALGGNDLTRS
ncbi:alpha/beta hydrolase [Roseococcus sp. SDR]|uniref:alpha/beta fold hydrolase n=1 Tax=Roseococcus sp. SDR TaxID=2835532 RepID=UPI001BCC85B6|nr:alpha/beta hydrolase [Roseococcus sp. SDR]MBS7792214.1 alpha/beta hydrolase [Roseococcus sp. SDR]MBV1847528.1 alpha/beta hydrolase [Roseococcus sp. SDR]